MTLAWIALLLAQTPEQLERENEAYRRILLDWGGLTRYGSENAEIKLRPGEDRVVFLGDEITENWPEKFFAGRPWFNRGITRQTVAQMLVRFRQDVISLKPKVVVIQAGTNDIASVMGPSTTGTMAEHFLSMIDLARTHGIRVVLASVTPVCDCAGKNQTARRSVGKILGVNEWLKEYAAAHGIEYADFYAVLVEGRAFKRELTADGLLPNAAGYAALGPVVERAILKSLANRP
jgi:lysophospholipase L1-like esterase